jgi:hypothetical protein
MNQREKMRELYSRLKGNKDRIITEYANAEWEKVVTRESNFRHLTPEAYAGRLYSDGVRKGWIIST